MSETISREQALALYEELPMPSTSDEHWRFTDLRGFDPHAVSDAPPSSTASPR